MSKAQSWAFLDKLEAKLGLHSFRAFLEKIKAELGLHSSKLGFPRRA